METGSGSTFLLERSSWSPEERAHGMRSLLLLRPTGLPQLCFLHSFPTAPAAQTHPLPHGFWVTSMEISQNALLMPPGSQGVCVGTIPLHLPTRAPQQGSHCRQAADRADPCLFQFPFKLHVISDGPAVNGPPCAIHRQINLFATPGVTRE